MPFALSRLIFYMSGFIIFEFPVTPYLRNTKPNFSLRYVDSVLMRCHGGEVVMCVACEELQYYLLDFGVICSTKVRL
jgi:hypothetical protein